MCRTYQAVLPCAVWSRSQSSSRACAVLAASSGDSWLPGSDSSGILHTAAHRRTLLSAAEHTGKVSRALGHAPPTASPAHTPRPRPPLPMLHLQQQQQGGRTAGTWNQYTLLFHRFFPVQKPSFCFRKFNFLKIDFLPFFNSSSENGVIWRGGVQVTTNAARGCLRLVSSGSLLTAPREHVTQAPSARKGLRLSGVLLLRPSPPAGACGDQESRRWGPRSAVGWARW